jgi:hypothetical protein
VSKRSRISLWPGWDTLSAVSDAHRLVNTLTSAHPHERPLTSAHPHERIGLQTGGAATTHLSGHHRRAYAPVAQYHVTSGRLRGAPGSNPGVPRPDACSGVPRLASGPVLEPFHPQGNSPRPRHLWRQSKPPVSDGVREWPPNRVTDRRCCHYAPVRAPPPVSRRAHPISNGDKGMGSSL